MRVEDVHAYAEGAVLEALHEAGALDMVFTLVVADAGGTPPCARMRDTSKGAYFIDSQTVIA